MASGRDDDVDWLYRDGDDEPDRTRQRPAADPRRVSFGESAAPSPKAADRPRVSPAPPPRPAAKASPARPAAAKPSAAKPSASRTAAANRRPGSSPTQQTGGRGGPPLARPPGRQRPPRRKRPVRRFLRVLGLVLVLWLAFLIGTPLYAWSSTTKVDAMPTGERPPDQPGDLWLLVGSDSREGLSEEDRKRLGTGDVEGRRTDTMMLLYVPPTGKPALISIPRDSYVPIPGHGRNKINAAYAFGGSALLIETLEQTTGLRIDHFAEVGFGGFVNVIDALGGIEMCPKTAIKDKFSHLDIPAGCQEMDGPTALGYVRMRYADPLGDLGRMQRQREMVAAVVKKAASPMTVLNPLRWWGIHTGAAKSLNTDRDTGLGGLLGVSGPMIQIGTGQGLTVMVPVSNANARTAAGSAMLWDREEALAMFAEIERGDTSNLGRFSKLPGE